MDFLNIAGIQFRTAGRIYDFNAGNYTLRLGDEVVVETERGPSLGTVVQLRYDKSEFYDMGKLKSILRRAADKDLKQNERLTADYVQKFTQGKIEYYKLKMKLIHCEVQFDGGKVLIYFTAPSRVDFRDLVKSLASGLKTRVELKQIGARDETKLLGGIGICGREYCCSSFLREFVPVSIKMAKNQNLALNPKKVSGGCGRLLCCLTYEDQYYVKVRHVLPPRGSIVQLPSGEKAKVTKVDFLNQRIEVENDLGHHEVIAAEKVTMIKRAYHEEGESMGGGDGWGDDIDPTLFDDDFGESGLDESMPEHKRSGKVGGNKRPRENRDRGERGPRPQNRSHQSERQSQGGDRHNQDNFRQDQQSQNQAQQNQAAHNQSARDGRRNRGNRRRNKKPGNSNSGPNRNPGGNPTN